MTKIGAEMLDGHQMRQINEMQRFQLTDPTKFTEFCENFHFAHLLRDLASNRNTFAAPENAPLLQKVVRCWKYTFLNMGSIATQHAVGFPNNEYIVGNAESVNPESRFGIQWQ